ARRSAVGMMQETSGGSCKRPAPPSPVPLPDLQVPEGLGRVLAQHLIRKGLQEVERLLFPPKAVQGDAPVKRQSIPVLTGGFEAVDAAQGVLGAALRKVERGEVRPHLYVRRIAPVGALQLPAGG